jgi:methionyl-tRNA formyltransferase
MGTINLHASLLPHYRGAAPINHVLINGEHTTGVTTFFINDQIDTGNLLFREEIQIFPYENAGDLHNRLMKLGARLVIKTIEELSDRAVVSMPQSQFLKPGETPKLAPKIFPENCLVQWDKSCLEINNLVRGLSPSPCAKSFLSNQAKVVSFKIYESQAEDESHSLKLGTLVSDEKNFLKIACGKGFLNILSIQAEGKKRMGISEFLRGFRISDFSFATNPQA